MDFQSRLRVITDGSTLKGRVLPFYYWRDRMNEKELYHYGIKGMRWGVRKDRRKGHHKSRLARRIESRKRRKLERKQIRKRIESIDRAQRKRAIDTDINALNDQQLRNLNDRIRNENSYKESIRVKRKRIIGAKLVGGLLSRNGNKIADKLVYFGIASLGALAVSKMLGKEKGDMFWNFIKPKEKGKGN